MKTKNYTNPNQSKKLIRLGFDTKTADTSLCINYKQRKLRIPSWSITRLLDLMPKKIIVFDEEYSFQIHMFDYDKKGFTVGYLKIGGIDYKTDKYYYLGNYASNNKVLIDAIYEVLIQLIENNYYDTTRQRFTFA